MCESLAYIVVQATEAANMAQNCRHLAGVSKNPQQKQQERSQNHVIVCLYEQDKVVVCSLISLYINNA